MKRKLLLLIILANLLFLSCVNEEPINCILPSPQTTVSSQVISGQSIFLKAIFEKEDESYSFEWVGPNNFKSNLQNPVITNATIAMSGDYSLRIKKGICQSDPKVSNVEVINNTVTCDVSKNTLNLSGIVNTPLYAVSSSETSGDKHRIYGSINSFYAELLFAGAKKPLTGLYEIVSSTSELNAKKVKVEVHAGISYFATSGTVLLYYDSDNNVVIKFCNVPCSRLNSTFTDTNATCTMTQDR